MGKTWKRRWNARRLAGLRAANDTTVETTPVVLEIIEAKTQKPITETVVPPPTTKTVETATSPPKKKKPTTKKRPPRKKTTKSGTTTSGT